MNKLSQISVIIPLYNRKHYIQQAVDSVLTQSFEDYEILILDNQSTDGSYELCMELYGKNPKVQVIRQNFQCGLGPARNLGISLARGKYVAFLDSDDLYVNDGLKMIYEVAEMTQAEVVHAPGWLESEEDDGQTITTASALIPRLADRLPFNGTISQLDSNVKNRMNMFVNNFFSLNAWSKLYLRDYLIKNDITFPDVLNEDVSFTMFNLMYAERYIRIPYLWNIYRKAPDSLSFGNTEAEFLSKIISSMIIGLKHMNENFKKCKFISENPEYAGILREHFLWHLLNFQLYRKSIYASNSLERLKNISDKVLSKYFDDDHLAFVSVLFNNLGIYQSRAIQLMHENQTLKKLINTNQFSEEKL